jgi:LysR family transcriptional regulator, salicylic acid-responsive activator of bsdBCD
MDLKRLRYFCTVVEQGSISQASRLLNMAQPPLSKRLQELEEELSVSLFLRNGRRVEPTEAGYFLYRKACEILREVEDTKRETILLAHRETKLLRIGLTHLFQSYFKSLVLEIHKRNPHVEIGISVSDSSHLEFLLNNGRIDIALIQKPYQSEGYDCIGFEPIKLIALASKKLMPEPPPGPVSFLEMGKYPLLLLRRADGAGTYESILDHLRKGGVQPNVVMHISQPGVIIDWLESGLEAVAFLPASEVNAARLEHSHVVELYSPPQIFFPAVVKMAAASYMKELMDIVETGYPFSSDKIGK